jgi:hypothetical protein
METVHDFSFSFLAAADGLSYCSGLRQKYIVVHITITILIYVYSLINQLDNHRKCPENA